MLAVLGEANLLFAIPAVAIYFFGVWLRAVRWRLLMEPFAIVPTPRLFAVIIIGFAVNNVMPFRVGELVRAILLRQSNGVPIAASLASILLERALDVVTLCALLAMVSLIVPLDGWLSGLAGLSWLVVTCAVVGLVVLTLAPRQLLRGAFDLAVTLAGRVSQRLARLVGSFLSGVRAVETPRSMFLVGGLSFACWACELGLYYFVMVAFGFNSGVLSLIVGMVVANLATVIPSSPGYLGTFDVPLQTVLTDVFDVAVVTASSFTLFTHALLLIPVVVVGFALLSREDVSFRALGRGKVELRTPQETGAAS